MLITHIKPKYVIFIELIFFFFLLAEEISGCITRCVRQPPGISFLVNKQEYYLRVNKQRPTPTLSFE